MKSIHYRKLDCKCEVVRDLLNRRLGDEARVTRVYESHKPALAHNYFIASKYCVLPHYVAKSCINDFPTNTFFYAHSRLYYIIELLATVRLAPVTGYKDIHFKISMSCLLVSFTSLDE